MITRAEEALELDDIPATLPETDDCYETLDQDDRDEHDWLREMSGELRRQFPYDR